MSSSRGSYANGIYYYTILLKKKKHLKISQNVLKKGVILKIGKIFK